MREVDAHLIAGLYDSITGDTGLEPAMVAIEESLDCVGATILSFDPILPSTTHATTVGAFDAAARQIYEAEYASVDPAPAAFARLPSGTVSSTNRLFTPFYRKKAVVLQEFLRPRGMEETVAGVISPSGGRFAMLAFFRGPDRAAFDEEDFGAMRRLLPHFAMALKLRRAFVRLETRASAMAEAIDRLPIGIVVLALDGAAHVNRIADLIAQRGDGLRFDRKGVPRAATREAELRLQAAIADARDGGAGGIVRLPRAEGAPPYVLLAAPLPGGNGFAGHDGRGRPVIVMIHDPSAMADIAPDAIAAAFDLPHQAADLLAALLAGEEAPAYAARRGLSYETVRYHLKTAFARTGTRSRARLMQAVGLALHDIAGKR